MENSKKQTAVEFLIEQIKSKADNLPTNTKENRMAKGIYVDCLIMARQAKEMEKQQSRDYAEFAIRCDRLGMKILNFDGYMNLKNNEKFNK